MRRAGRARAWGIGSFLVAAHLFVSPSFAPEPEPVLWIGRYYSLETAVTAPRAEHGTIATRQGNELRALRNLLAENFGGLRDGRRQVPAEALASFKELTGTTPYYLSTYLGILEVLDSYAQLATRSAVINQTADALTQIAIAISQSGQMPDLNFILKQYEKTNGQRNPDFMRQNTRGKLITALDSEYAQLRVVAIHGLKIVLPPRADMQEVRATLEAVHARLDRDPAMTALEKFACRELTGAAKQLPNYDGTADVKLAVSGIDTKLDADQRGEGRRERSGGGSSERADRRGGSSTTATVGSGSEVGLRMAEVAADAGESEPTRLDALRFLHSLADAGRLEDMRVLTTLIPVAEGTWLPGRDMVLRLVPKVWSVITARGNEQAFQRCAKVAFDVVCGLLVVEDQP